MGLAGAFAPVGRVVFAGEHTAEHSGYMDGAAESGRVAAEAVLRLLG
jgi:monoamine oxidase